MRLQPVLGCSATRVLVTIFWSQQRMICQRERRTALHGRAAAVARIVCVLLNSDEAHVTRLSGAALTGLHSEAAMECCISKSHFQVYNSKDSAGSTGAQNVSIGGPCFALKEQGYKNRASPQKITQKRCFSFPRGGRKSNASSGAI